LTAPSQPVPNYAPSGEVSLKERFVERSLEKIIYLQKHPPLRRRDLLMPLALLVLALVVWFRPAPGTRQLQQKIDALQTRLDKLENAPRSAARSPRPAPPVPTPVL
jgi:hypothetical protein